MKSTELVALLLLMAAGCSRQEIVSANAVLPPAQVRLAAVQVENRPQLTEISGTIRPVQRAVLAAKVMGAISELPIALGLRVKADDVLVKIFSADVAARLAQVRAQRNVVRRDVDREKDLLAKGASTAETVRNLQDQLTASEAMVRDAEVQLGYTEIRAPFDGVVARKIANAGDLAMPGQPLLEVEGLVDFEIEASIPESFMPALTLGAFFDCEVGGITFAGTLREISSAGDPVTRSIGVKLAVPPGTAVRSGQFTRVRVPGTVVRSLLVPVTAVSISGQMERVFVAEESGTGVPLVGETNLGKTSVPRPIRAALRLVKTGGKQGDRVEIISGLAASDRVVVAPPAGLREGQPLEALP